MNARQFTSIKTAREFALAGNALFTISSLKTGARFTCRVRQAKDQKTGELAPNLFFVSLLNGPDNENGYCCLGIIRNRQFTLAKAGKAGNEAPSVVAFTFFMTTPVLHPQMEIRHQDKCGRCGRTLTVPSSIDAGIGPECATKI